MPAQSIDLVHHQQEVLSAPGQQTQLVLNFADGRLPVIFARVRLISLLRGGFPQLLDRFGSLHGALLLLPNELDVLCERPQKLGVVRVEPHSVVLEHPHSLVCATSRAVQHAEVLK